MYRTIVIIIAASAFVAACGGGNDASAPLTTTALAERMSSADIDCRIEPDDEPLDKFVSDSAQCEVEGEDVGLYTFKDGGARRNWYATIETITCAVFDGAEFYSVEIGSTGVIGPETETLADAISDAMDGSVHTIRC